MKTKHKKDFLSEHTESEELNRIILLSEDVSQESVGDIILRILYINEQDDLGEQIYLDFTREPIKLIINSYGGSIYDGLALIDCIDASKTPIHTICYGSAMSMGMVILISGHVRYAGKYSTIMHHGSSYVAEGKIENHKQELKEIERVDKICDEIIISRTKLTRKSINKKMSGITEWYISATEALELRIIDEII